MSHISFYAGLTIKSTSNDKKERLLKLKNVIKEHSHGLLDYEIKSDYKGAFDRSRRSSNPYLRHIPNYLKDDIIIIVENSDFMLGYDDQLDYDQYRFCWPSYLHDLQYIQTKYFQNDEICLHLSNKDLSAYYYCIIHFKDGLIDVDWDWEKSYKPDSPELINMLHDQCECNESVEVDWEYVHDRIEKESKNIYIINPDTNTPVTIDEWSKDADPTRATLLAIKTAEDAPLLVVRKSYYLPGLMDFDDAQKACADYVDNSLPNKTFRCPTRKECIDLYDARFNGLDEAVKLTGGDYADDYKYHWTCDRDVDSSPYAHYAWYNFGYNGRLECSPMDYTYHALPVTLIDIREANSNF